MQKCRVEKKFDGYTSSSALIQFLWSINPDLDINFLLNFEKHHGLTYSDICDYPQDYYDLIIIPDASMDVVDAKIIKENFTADVVVLDHHLVTIADDGDTYMNYCTAVNCTDGQYPNPCLSGAGVVQKFIEAYITHYGLDPSLRLQWIDLIGASLVADNMSLKTLENRYYLAESLKNTNYRNLLLNEIETRTKEKDDWQERCIKTVGWKLAPLVNGCIRAGTSEEQTRMFQAICGWNEDVKYQPRRKHKEDPLPAKEIHSLQWDVARNLVNIKSRQDTEIRKLMKEIVEAINNQGLDKHSAIIVDATKIITKGSVTGALANKIASAYMRPVLLMRSKNALEFGGSMRGYDGGVIENAKEFFENTGLVKIAGHPGAGGLTMNKSDLETVIQKCDELCNPSLVGVLYKCDWEIPAKKLKKEYIIEVGENYKVFGGDIPEPLFFISGLEINASEINGYGDTKSFIRFTYNGIPFVKKYCKSGEFERLTCDHRDIIGINHKNLRINIVGQFGLSMFNGNLYPQVKIIDFESEEIVEEQNEKEEDHEWDFLKADNTVIENEDFAW